MAREPRILFNQILFRTILHAIQGLVQKIRPSRSQGAYCMQRLDYAQRCKIATKFLNQFIRHQNPTLPKPITSASAPTPRSQCTWLQHQSTQESWSPGHQLPNQPLQYVQPLSQSSCNMETSNHCFHPIKVLYCFHTQRPRCLRSDAPRININTQPFSMVLLPHNFFRTE